MFAYITIVSALVALFGVAAVPNWPPAGQGKPPAGFGRPPPPAGQGSAQYSCPRDWSKFQLLPHERDCTKFYSCANGEKYLFSCAEGTAFNYDIQVCDYISNVKCNSPRSSEAVEVSSLEARSLAYSQDKPSGQGNSPSSQSNSPWSQGNSLSSQGNSPWSQGNSPSDQGKPQSNQVKPPATQNSCPRDWSKFQLLPHENDCTKFYSCSNGVKYLFSCAEGTAFDFDRQVCDYIFNVKCKSPKIFEAEEIPSVAGRSLAFSSPSSQGSSQLSQGNSPSSQGRPQSGYNKPPSSQGNSPSSQANSPSSQGIPPSSQGKPQSGSNQPSAAQNSCPRDWSKFQLLPHEVDCTKFYSCSNGVKYLFSCPEGTAFDFDGQVCDYVYNVKCKSSKSLEAVEVVSLDSRSLAFSSPSSQGNSPSSQGRPQSSQGNSPSSQGRPQSSQGNSPSSQGKPQSGSNKPPVAQNSCPRDWSKFQLLPHESDCTKFYSCSNGVKYLFSCAEGTAFDFDGQVCDWSQKVKCSNRN